MLPFLIHFSLLSQCSCMRTICPEGHRNHLNMKDEELAAICQQCSFKKLCQHEAIREFTTNYVMYEQLSLLNKMWSIFVQPTVCRHMLPSSLLMVFRDLISEKFN